MKTINLLGATGSIGTQTLDIIRSHSDLFQLVSLSFGSNLHKGIEIINEFQPQFVSVKSKEDAAFLKQLYPEIEIGYGLVGLIEAAIYEAPQQQTKPIVVTAVVGSIGLTPTIAAIKKGFDIALANKETLVTAGHIVMDLARQYNVQILPVDSEHSAIFQCLNGENSKKIKELIITASGGSFRDKTRDELKDVTLEDALKHPNWSMGHKITIDSATMMNKGFEVIEAHYLFDLPFEQIKTILHKESVIHSMVEFIDTSIMAQLGTPDMRLPIQYALNYPSRIELNNSKRLKLYDIGLLHFKEMDYRRFPLLKYAYDAGKTGGSMPTVLNASNDAAVSLFLDKKIHFLDIEKIVYDELSLHRVISNPDLETVLSIDREIKEKVYSTYSKGE